MGNDLKSFKSIIERNKKLKDGLLLVLKEGLKNLVVKQPMDLKELEKTYDLVLSLIHSIDDTISLGDEYTEGCLMGVSDLRSNLDKLHFKLGEYFIISLENYKGVKRFKWFKSYTSYYITKGNLIKYDTQASLVNSSVKGVFEKLNQKEVDLCFGFTVGGLFKSLKVAFEGYLTEKAYLAILNNIRGLLDEYIFDLEQSDDF